MATKMMHLTSNRTYATEERAIKAARQFGEEAGNGARFMIVWNREGRCYPVFFGSEAVQLGTHFIFVTVA